MKNIQNIKGHLSIARKTAKRNADNALAIAAKRGVKLINEDTSVDAVWLRNMARESNKLQA